MKLVYVVYPKLNNSLKKFIKHLILEKIIVCANITNKIQSHYFWNNKVESANEVVVLYKIKSSNYKKLVFEVEKQHPYETPFVGSINLSAVNKKYLMYGFK